MMTSLVSALARGMAKSRPSLLPVTIICTAISFLTACSSLEKIRGVTGGVSDNPTRYYIPGGDASKTPLDWYRDEKELARTWQAAMVRLPDSDGGVVNTTTHSSAFRNWQSDSLLPVVIYLHGCAGFWEGSHFRMNWLAEKGFAVIAPNSLARIYYPSSCDPASFRSGLYRPTMVMRQLDAAYAITQVRELPWIDAQNIFLMGLSEGAAVTAMMDNSGKPEQAVKARIVEAWGCRTGWSEYQGLAAPEAEPVLALVADRDKWYNNPWQSGNCAEFMSSTNGSVSHVVTRSPLQFGHELMQDEQIQSVVHEFLQAQLAR